jgi:tetratricopeptide (TPR) repeat protein
VALLRQAVDDLFTEDYLVARGLDPRAATEHNDLVTHALEVVLTASDAQATFANVVPEHFEPLAPVLGLVTGFAGELPLRLAAYEARYGYLHPFLAEVAAWLKGPNLKPWWESQVRRAVKPIHVSTLYKDGELESHTVRDLRDGKTLPKEATLPVLARRLAAHGIRDRTEDRHAQASELEFELRVAVAVAERRDLVERLLSPRADDVVVMALQLICGVLQAAPDVMTAELLRNGTHAACWPAVHEAFQATLLGSMVERLSVPDPQGPAHVDQDPVSFLRAEADFERQMARECRQGDPRPGADGPEQRQAEVHELKAERIAALASEPRGAPPVRRPELAAEIQADRLILETKAAWAPLPAHEKEQRLREAVRIAEGSSYAQRELGCFLLHTRRTDEAVVHLRRSVELNPANETGREFLCLVSLDRADHEAVLALAPDNARSTLLRAARALALFHAGDADAAEKLAQAVREEHPRHPLALRVLAQCERSRGEVGKAQKLERDAEFFERGMGFWTG